MIVRRVVTHETQAHPQVSVMQVSLDMMKQGTDCPDQISFLNYGRESKTRNKLSAGKR